MLKITRFTCEQSENLCVTDRRAPRFSFAAESDKQGAKLKIAEIEVNGSRMRTAKQIGVSYEGAPLRPFTRYEARLLVEDIFGETAEAALTFETGRLDTAWQAEWITDGAYKFREKKMSPVPIAFRKTFALRKKLLSAKVCATALGIYELSLNGKKVGDEYFAPGFTNYRKNLQYQTYDITDGLRENNVLTATVAGGWAVGAFVMNRKNRITAPRQTFMAEIRLVYEDGSTEILGTDPSWDVTRQSPVRFAEFYDGEIYDARVDLQTSAWRPAAIEKVKIRPRIEAAYGAPVRAHEVFRPVSVRRMKNGELIYDFGQNFAGVVRFRVNAAEGQQIVVRHAEILDEEGGLQTSFLRTAKSTVVYICREGMQEYSPRMTYMGFRYAGVTGVSQSAIELEAVALYSDLPAIGTFTCSDERLNRLQSNIVWSGKSNFMDIPTDCPQRDERMGWTGDIAVFASTACFNFNMSRFLEKWLKDVKSEQTRGGGIPNTVPSHGYGFPLTMPKKAIAFWGDACIMAPWAQYMAYGDKAILETMYPVMKKYVKACLFWAKLFSFGKKRYLWSDIPAMQFGDWVAPDVSKMSEWQARCKWTGTASLANSCDLLSKIAAVLGHSEDRETYKALREKVADAYCSLLTDGNGKLYQEFQTAYVLPLQFKMFPETVQRSAAKNLARLLEENEYLIGTGFPGTPYLLFALADNGYADVAFRVMTNRKCPSWLYEVEQGATTVWERWDGLDENGKCPIANDGTGGMISFNHYAFGAVGDFLYRRVAGIEPVEAGYKTFRIAPLMGEEIDSARAQVETPYGRAAVYWKRQGGKFTLEAEVPMGTICILKLPSGEQKMLESGKFRFHCEI